MRSIALVRIMLMTEVTFMITTNNHSSNSSHTRQFLPSGSKAQDSGIRDYVKDPCLCAFFCAPAFKLKLNGCSFFLKWIFMYVHIHIYIYTHTYTF